MEPADGAVVSTWIASDVQARNDALQATARAAVSALDVGFSVGLFHLKLFGARLDVRDGQAARLDLALTRAPLATPYGKSVCTTAPAAELESLTYPRLRYRGIVPAAEAGQIASPMTDAAAFLLFALDVLSAHVTPNVTAPWQTWEDVWMSIDSRADVAFRDPVMVRSLTRAVRENRPLPIWEFIRALAR
jgi:hypothetical protein